MAEPAEIEFAHPITITPGQKAITPATYADMRFRERSGDHIAEWFLDAHVNIRCPTLALGPNGRPFGRRRRSFPFVG